MAIIAGIAAATVGSAKVDWMVLAEDYDRIRITYRRHHSRLRGLQRLRKTVIMNWSIDMVDIISPTIL